MSDYDTLGQVGEGTYGQVFKAKHKPTSTLVALKKLYLKEDDKGKEKNRDGFPITAIREIEILRSLKHENIVELQAMVSISNQDRMEMYMVFEYMDYDITGILSNNVIIYSLSHIKCLAKQLFQGLEHLHKQKIIHRDIKGANLLLNRDGYLKIADFGLARRIHIDRDSGLMTEGFEYTNRVVTLWYRSPELLLGSTHYGYEVDLWSAGCILMEFYTKSAIFQGRTEIDQLELIFQLCGSPKDDDWPLVKNLPWYGLITFPNSERRLVKEFTNASYGLSTEFVSLVDGLLQLDPTKRLTATQSLKHDFFQVAPFACEPQELPKIDGDWHEFESKVRKKKPLDKRGDESPDYSSSIKIIDDDTRVESTRDDSKQTKRARSRSSSRDPKRVRSRSQTPERDHRFGRDNWKRDYDRRDHVRNERRDFDYDKRDYYKDDPYQKRYDEPKQRREDSFKDSFKRKFTTRPFHNSAWMESSKYVMPK